MNPAPGTAEPLPADGAVLDVEALLALIDVERLDRDLFRGHNVSGLGRGSVFGGLIAAQALRAAQRTTPVDRPVHSLHSYFIRPGRWNTPVVYDVSRLRDGGSFTTREVTALQDGEAIYSVLISFHAPEPGPEQSSPPTVPVERPGPEVPRRIGKPASRPFEVVELHSLAGPWRSGEAAFRALLRPRGSAPDQTMSACLVAYASDMNTAFSVCRAAGIDTDTAMIASLDHSIWFHRPLVWDDWLVMELRPMANAAARGLVVGTLHDADGAQIASLAQEALYRERRA